MELRICDPHPASPNPSTKVKIIIQNIQDVFGGDAQRAVGARFGMKRSYHLSKENHHAFS
jgi:hypothetical protein